MESVSVPTGSAQAGPANEHECMDTIVCDVPYTSLRLYIRDQRPAGPINQLVNRDIIAGVQ